MLERSNDIMGQRCVFELANTYFIFSKNVVEVQFINFSLTLCLLI